MIWIFTIVSVLLLIFSKCEAYRKIAITAVVISIIWILPIVGYEDMYLVLEGEDISMLLVFENIDVYSD